MHFRSSSPKKTVYAGASLLALLLSNTQAATFTVDTTSDSALSACNIGVANDCSLRGAILAANATPVADLIEFNIPQSDPGFQATTQHWRISVADNMPLFSTGPSVLIDGYSQPGSSANTNTASQGGLNGTLKIEVRGVNPTGNANYAFFLDSDSPSVLRGLAVSGFRDGQVYLRGAGAHRIEGCYLGTDVTGSSAALLSGTQPISNGVIFAGNGSYVVGGSQASERNLMSGFNFAMTTNGNALASVRIQGNLIGTNAAGNAVIGNTFGLLSFRFGTTLIGGTDPNARNVFSGHTGQAMLIRTATTAGVFANTSILGNYFGTDVSGTRALGNDFQRGGSTIEFASVGCALKFGGIAPGEANLIAYSATAGVAVSGCNNLQTPLNRYRANQGVAFDNFLGNLGGASSNDPNDPDEGGNRLQNFPELTLPTAGSNLLSFRVDTAAANAAYPITVNFYRGACGGGSDALVGSATINAAQAQQTQTIDVNSLGSYLPLTATAVDADGNTSEFAPMLGDAIFRGDFEDVSAALTPGRCL
jgi:CSLREA domain-containing protein